MAAFYAVVIEPRPEFAAKGRQTPTRVSLGYNRRGMTAFYTVAIEPRLEFAAKGRQTAKAAAFIKRGDIYDREGTNVIRKAIYGTR